MQAPQRPELDWERPLAGKVALVTGAARGIGAAIAEVLARDGAHVVGVDVPAQREELDAGWALGGSSLRSTSPPRCARAIAAHLLERHGGVDVIVHNAGITRDKTLGRMDEEPWGKVIDDQPDRAASGSTTSCSRAARCVRTGGSCASPRSAGSPATPVRPTTRPPRPA